MREILFRGKRMDNGEWIFGAYLTADSRHYICNEDVFDDVDPETVGQFTGLLDKNGIRIFENDLVRTSWFVLYKVALVAYSQGGFRVCPLGSQVKTELGKYVPGGVEIIGNVYDKPKLLEGRAEL